MIECTKERGFISLPCAEKRCEICCECKIHCRCADLVGFPSGLDEPAKLSNSPFIAINNYFGVIAGLYTVRMIWNHGHWWYACAIAVGAIVIGFYELRRRR